MRANTLKANTMKLKNPLEIIKSVPPVVWIMLVMMATFSVLSPEYLKLKNMSNIIIQSVPLMLVAFAQTLIVLTQGTDLSLGMQVSLTSVLWVFLMTKGVPVYVGALITIVVSMLSGTINGLVVSKWKIPPFIATLGMQNILYSIALLLTAGASIFYPSPVFRIVAEMRIIGLPLTVWITALMFVVTWTILYKTKLGAHVFGLGGNAEALVLAGVDTVKSSVMIYAYAGLLTSISGLLITCRLESGQPIVGQGWEFEAVAAVLLGGTSMREGKGGITGTIFGVLLITIIKNGLNLVGLFSIYQNAVIGIIILAAIVIDNVARRLKDK